MICKCPNCGAIGERFAIGEYIVNDESFKCKKCWFKGRTEKRRLNEMQGDNR
jgi:transposase-like protein